MEGSTLRTVKATPFWLAAAVLLLTVCIGALPQAAQAISGFDPRCIEIDTWAAGADVLNQPGALNNSPACGDVFIDWADFGASLADHRILDGVGNADPDIVGPQDKLVSGSSLPKEDIYNLFLSNNIDYMYLAMARRSNNGNSTYHWFFTKISPTAVPNQPIVFHLQNGDTEVRVCFPKGSAPQDFTAQIFQVSGLAPAQVVDVSASDIWSTVALTENAAAVGGFSINLENTTALPGALDDHGNPTGIYETAEFAEGAADLSELGISPCGTTAYVTVLTRSSCSLTSSLKDISGPTPYVFGAVTVAAGTPTIGCTTASGADVSLVVTASGGSGSYNWTWPAGWSHTESADTKTSTGTATLAAGDYNVCVSAADASAAGCSDEACVAIHIDPPISLTLDITSTLDCVSSVDLRATASGGDGDYTYTWRVDGSVVLTDHQAGGGASDYTLVFPDDEYCGARTVTVDVQDGHGCSNPPPGPSKTLTKATAITAE